MRLNRTIDNKRLFTKPNGDKVVDLTQQNFKPTPFVKFYDAFVVSADFVMRPDLIAYTAYRDINAVDVILKQNQISNPFSIDENDLIFIQERRSIDIQFATNSLVEVKKLVRSQYIDSSKEPIIDKNLQNFKNRKKPKKSKKSTPALPPNFANFGDTELTFRGGKVIFGENVTGNADVCNELPLSKSEFLKRLAKNRLNKNNNTL